MVGTRARHLLAELWGCPAALLDDQPFLEAALREACEACGCQVLSVHAHAFAPHGVTAIALLAESHASIHTWPEDGYAAVDVYTCGDGDPHAAHAVLQERLRASQVEVKVLTRGEPPCS